jgi:hypothetical protein
MSATMITPVECRQHAVECQRMAERAANLRMQSILIDMARTWQRLSLEVEQSQQKNESLLPYDPHMLLCAAPAVGPAAAAAHHIIGTHESSFWKR